MNTNYKFKLDVHHTQPFRNLFDVLQSILTEGNIDVMAGLIKYNKKKDEINNEIELIPDSDEDEDSDDEDNKDKDNDEDEDIDEDSDEDSDENSEDKTKKTKKSKKTKKTKKKAGLKIQAIDPAAHVYVHAKIEGFAYFKCDEDYTFGISMKQLFKHIKTLDKDDTLSMYVEETDENKLWLEFKNPETERVSKMSMSCRDLDSSGFDMPTSRFAGRIAMSAGEFNKIIKELSSFASVMDLEIKDNQVTFSGKSAISFRETILKQNDKMNDLAIQWEDTTKKDVPNYFKETYELKYLSIFSKCHSLCHHVEIFFGYEFPLLLRYDVGKIGKVMFCIAPHVNAQNNSKFKDVKNTYAEAEVDIIDNEDEDE